MTHRLINAFRLPASPSLLRLCVLFPSGRIFLSLCFFASTVWGLSRPLLVLGQASSIDPNELVLRAVERAVWGPSVSYRVRQASIWGNHRALFEGRYWQMGGGTGQLKLELAYESGDEKGTFLQISDGRLVWTNLGAGEGPRRVYLDRVRESLGGLVRQPSVQAEASLYLAIGGHAEVMRCLYTRYRWYKVFAGIDDRGREVWQLLGTLRTEPPALYAKTTVDGLLLVRAPNPEIPSHVRLTLGRDEKWKLIPLKIDYYRRLKEASDEPGKLARVSTIENDELVSPVELAADFFDYRVSDDADRIDDETNGYLPLHPQAALPAPTRR